MASNPYVHLGWNPVPGQPGEVENLRVKLQQGADALQDASSKIDRLLGESSYWEGDAAVGFREALDGDLPTYMRDAHTSLEKAAKAMDTWHGGLTSRRELAKKYDAEARDHKSDLEAANGRYDRANSDPDLKLAGQTFDSVGERDAAQARLDAATKALNEATTAVNKAQGALDDVMKKAHELEADHADAAHAIAKALGAATKDLAPEEPNWLEKSLSWIGDNLTDILGVLGAIAGLLAIVLTGPVGIAFLVAAAALSAATLLTRLTDPQVQASLSDGFNKGELDADFWSNTVGIAGDILGVAPGLGAVSRGLNGAVAATHSTGEAVSAGQFISRFADDTVTAGTRLMNGADPVGDLIVRGLGGGAAAENVVKFTSPVGGLATAGYGLAADGIDAVSNDSVKNGTTAVDGARLGLDGPATGVTIMNTFRALVRL
ncbi:hypothetical protein [Streptomyces sp. V3I7]|uniref:hypothetical protein n=1 Tax=Streptomyces sp. V3I7 TaxID=3042278 RepID=UPI0027D8FD20|nr:hypothetical protein [Streptomyces sp. V3I7]